MTRVQFNMDHYIKVRRARQKAGLPVAELSEKVTHPLVGKKLRNLESGKVYNVEKVFKEFYLGWFYKAVIECDGSHGVIFFENITCGAEEVLNQIEAFPIRFEVVESEKKEVPYRNYDFWTKFGDHLGSSGTNKGLTSAANGMRSHFMDHSRGYEPPGQIMVSIKEDGQEIMRCLYSFIYDGPVNLTPLEASLLSFLKPYKDVQQFEGVEL
jgi:hypothetical protein